MVSWVQAVCSSAAAMAWAASARAARSTSSDDWCACARTCSASASTACAWVSASLRRASASWTASARTAAACSSAEIRSSSAARTVSSCCWRMVTVAMVRSRCISAAVVATVRSAAVVASRCSRSASATGAGDLVEGGGPLALGELVRLGDDPVPLGLGRLEQHADLLARVADGLAGLARRIGEQGLRLGAGPAGGLPVGGRLVVQPPRLGLEHLGQRGRLGGLLLGLVAQLVGHLLGVQQQLGSRRAVGRLRARVRARLRVRLGARMWVDRLHSVHQVLVRRPRPPQAPYLVGSRTRGAYCPDHLGWRVRELRRTGPYGSHVWRHPLRPVFRPGDVGLRPAAASTAARPTSSPRRAPARGRRTRRRT